MNYTTFLKTLSTIEDVSVEWDTHKLEATIRTNGHALARVYTNESTELYTLYAVTKQMVSDEYTTLMSAVEAYARTPIHEQLDGLYYIKKSGDYTRYLIRSTSEWAPFGRYDFRGHEPFLFSKEDIKGLPKCIDTSDYELVNLPTTKVMGFWEQHRAQ